MIYTGFCNKQNENYSVEFTQIPTSSLEDKTPNFINGRLKCEYAGITGCCNNPNQCSVLQNFNK